MSRDILDAFERRHGKRQFENEQLPKLTGVEKRLFCDRLQTKIVALQNQLDKESGSNLDNLKLSQMTLMWIYDQVFYGKL